MFKIRIENLNKIILLVGSFSLSIEYIFNLASNSAYIGPSINWLIFPILIFIDLNINFHKYLKKKNLRWPLLLSIPLIIFFVSGYDANVPNDMSRFSALKSGINSLIIFMFYMVNSDSYEKRKAIIYGLTAGSVFGIFFQFLATLGYIPNSIESAVIKGIGVEVSRVGALGDPNQSVIYILSLSAFIIYNNYNAIFKYKSLVSLICIIITGLFVVSTGSRAGMAALLLTIFLTLFLSWKDLSSKSKKSFLFLVSTSMVILFFIVSEVLINYIKMAILSRWIYAVEYEDDSLNHRLSSYNWMFTRIFTNPNISGIGYLNYYREFGHLLPGGENNLRYPHASFVDCFIIGGLPLFVFYSYIWFKSSFNLVKTFYLKNIHPGIKGEIGFFLVLLPGFFLITSSLSIIWLKLTWALLGIAQGTNINNDEFKNSSTNKGCA